MPVVTCIVISISFCKQLYTHGNITVSSLPLCMASQYSLFSTAFLLKNYPSLCFTRQWWCFPFFSDRSFINTFLNHRPFCTMAWLLVPGKMDTLSQLSPRPPWNLSQESKKAWVRMQPWLLFRWACQRMVNHSRKANVLRNASVFLDGPVGQCPIVLSRYNSDNVIFRLLALYFMIILWFYATLYEAYFFE
jgi:hypothetical protein